MVDASQLDSLTYFNPSHSTNSSQLNSAKTELFQVNSQLNPTHSTQLNWRNSTQLNQTKLKLNSSNSTERNSPHPTHPPPLFNSTKLNWTDLTQDIFESQLNPTQLTQLNWTNSQLNSPNSNQLSFIEFFIENPALS